MNDHIDGQQTHIRGIEIGHAMIIDADDGNVSVSIFRSGGHLRATFTQAQAQAMIEALHRAMEVTA
jgi:hypothetical protein